MNPGLRPSRVVHAKGPFQALTLWGWGLCGEGSQWAGAWEPQDLALPGHPFSKIGALTPRPNILSLEGQESGGPPAGLWEDRDPQAKGASLPSGPPPPLCFGSMLLLLSRFSHA